MKLGEALSKLKKEQSRLARLILLRKQNIFVEKGKKPKFNPNELSKEVDNKIREIRKLKIKIQETNLKTNLSGESLAEAILKVNDIRSKLSSLSKLFDDKPRSFSLSREDKEYVETIDETEIEDLIEKLEVEKAQLDNTIQVANWTTKLL